MKRLGLEPGLEMHSQVSYVYDQKVVLELDKVEQIAGRANLVHQLISAYGLFSKMQVLCSKPATEWDLISFHSRDYIDFLHSVNDSSDLEKYGDDEEDFGLGYDCPLIQGIYDFACAVAGSSITAAETLVSGSAKAAVNWCGGWHHSQRDGAEGFCYVNDIVCAIHKLKEKFSRILYVDLDIHHGNGVENAFSFTQSVMTLSVHKYEVGFFPCTGALSDVGEGKGRYYTVNVPLRDGIRDQPYSTLFDRVAGAAFSAYKPDAVVVQCGTDSLTGDPLGTFNLTPKSLGHCVKTVLSWKLPTLFLGGGGYNHTNTARCLTYLTSIITNIKISTDIPEHENFILYGPCFDLDIPQSNRPDCNSKEYLENVFRTISENLKHCALNIKL